MTATFRHPYTAAQCIMQQNWHNSQSPCAGLLHTSRAFIPVLKFNLGKHFITRNTLWTILKIRSVPQNTTYLRYLDKSAWICVCKWKVKLSLSLTKHYVMKTYWGRRGIAPRILNLGPGDERWALPPWERAHPYPIDRTGPRTGLDAMAKRKKSHYYPCRESNPDRPARNLFSVLTLISNSCLDK
jgi:hypothetical protein